MSVFRTRKVNQEVDGCGLGAVLPVAACLCAVGSVLVVTGTSVVGGREQGIGVIQYAGSVLGESDLTWVWWSGARSV